MNSVFLLVRKSRDWSPELWMKSIGADYVGGGQFVIEKDGDWLSVLRNDRIIDDFDISDVQYIQELMDAPSVYLLEWTKGAIFMKMLSTIPSGIESVIDNDHGLLIETNQLINRPIETWIKAANL